MADRGEGPGEIILLGFIVIIIIMSLLAVERGGDVSKIGDFAAELAPFVIFLAVAAAAIWALIGSG